MALSVTAIEERLRAAPRFGTTPAAVLLQILDDEEGDAAAAARPSLHPPPCTNGRNRASDALHGPPAPPAPHTSTSSHPEAPSIPATTPWSASGLAHAAPAATLLQPPPDPFAGPPHSSTPAHAPVPQARPPVHPLQMAMAPAAAPPAPWLANSHCAGPAPAAAPWQPPFALKSERAQEIDRLIMHTSAAPPPDLVPPSPSPKTEALQPRVPEGVAWNATASAPAPPPDLLPPTHAYPDPSMPWAAAHAHAAPAAAAAVATRAAGAGEAMDLAWLRAESVGYSRKRPRACEPLTEHLRLKLKVEAGDGAAVEAHEPARRMAGGPDADSVGHGAPRHPGAHAHASGEHGGGYSSDGHGSAECGRRACTHVPPPDVDMGGEALDRWVQDGGGRAPGGGVGGPGADASGADGETDKADARGRILRLMDSGTGGGGGQNGVSNSAQASEGVVKRANSQLSHCAIEFCGDADFELGNKPREQTFTCAAVLTSQGERVPLRQRIFRSNRFTGQEEAAAACAWEGLVLGMVGALNRGVRSITIRCADSVMHDVIARRAVATKDAAGVLESVALLSALFEECTLERIERVASDVASLAEEAKALPLWGGGDPPGVFRKGHRGLVKDYLEDDKRKEVAPFMPKPMKACVLKYLARIVVV